MHVAARVRIVMELAFKAIHSRKNLALNITSETIVGPMIMFGARWAVKNINFRRSYT